MQFYKQQICFSAECHLPLICLKPERLDFKEIIVRLPFLVINLQPDTKSDLMNAYLNTTDPTDEALPRSEDLMDECLEASVKNNGGARESYLLRETMLSLVRLLKSEQLVDMRKSVNKLVPPSLRSKPIRRASGRRPPFSHAGQSDLLLGRPD